MDPAIEQAVKDAVEREREECAKLAESMNDPDNPWNTLHLAIAEAIRKRKPFTNEAN